MKTVKSAKTVKPVAQQVIAGVRIRSEKEEALLARQIESYSNHFDDFVIDDEFDDVSNLVNFH